MVSSESNGSVDLAGQDLFRLSQVGPASCVLVALRLRVMAQQGGLRGRVDVTVSPLLQPYELIAQASS